jgi:hypothetical protein
VRSSRLRPVRGAELIAESTVRSAAVKAPKLVSPLLAVKDWEDRWLPGVAEVGYDGAVAAVTAGPTAVVRVAAELARRELAAADFTVTRPSLEDAVVSLMNGGQE